MAVFSNGPVMMVSGLALAAVAGGAAYFMNDRPEKAADAASASVAPAQEADASAGDAAAPATASSPEPAPVDAAPAANGSGVVLAQSDGPIDLSFSRGTVEDLRSAGLSAEVEKVSSVAGVADETKVWIAEADIASAPGDETLYHVKGPLTCGGVGCDLIIVDAAGDTLLETVGEGVSAPQTDTLIINEGSPGEVTWVFDGARYVVRR